MKQFYYTYKITLLKGSLAGHYYYGQHTTKHLTWTYAGSGKIISDYYNKYGKIEHQTYIKEIIAFYNNEDELNQAEYDLIGDKYKTDPMCLNLIAGGQRKGISDETREKHRQLRLGYKQSDEIKKKIGESNKGKNTGKHSNLGRISPTKGKHWKLDPETNKRIYY